MIMVMVPISMVIVGGDLLHHLVFELLLLCRPGVRDGGILSGQSAVTWPYSSQSKHFIRGH